MNQCLDRRGFFKIVGGAAACAGLAPSRVWAAATAVGAPHAEKLGWRLGCATYSLRHLAFFEAVEKVASFGLHDIVGMNWQKLRSNNDRSILNEKMSLADRQETKKRLGDAGVRLPACYCRIPEQMDDCRRLFEFAKEMGLETIDGEPSFGAYDMLEKLCDEYQVGLAVHNHTKPSKYWQPETLLKLIEGRSKRLGACCDVGHWVRSGMNPVDNLRKLEGRILAFDFKDVNENGVCVPFGTGKGHIKEILQELHRQKFRGVFGIEYDQFGVKKGEKAPDAEAEIPQCVAYFDKVAQELAGA